MIPAIKWHFGGKWNFESFSGFGEAGEVLMVGVRCRGHGGVLVRVWWKSEEGTWCRKRGKKGGGVQW